MERRVSTNHPLLDLAPRICSIMATFRGTLYTATSESKDGTPKRMSRPLEVKSYCYERLSTSLVS